MMSIAFYNRASWLLERLLTGPKVTLLSKVYYTVACKLLLMLNVIDLDQKGNL